MAVEKPVQEEVQQNQGGGKKKKKNKQPKDQDLDAKMIQQAK